MDGQIVTIDEIRTWPVTVGMEEARRALGISRAHAYHLAAQGEFPCRVLKLGGRYRVITASLIGVIEGTEAPARSPEPRQTPRPPDVPNITPGRNPTHDHTESTRPVESATPGLDDYEATAEWRGRAEPVMGLERRRPR